MQPTRITISQWFAAWLLLALLIFSAPVGGQDNDEKVLVNTTIGGVDAADVSAESEFSASSLVAVQYLAIRVKISKTGIEALSATLTRGPKKANSAVADLWVRAYSVGKDAPRMEYRIADPRLHKNQNGAWVAADSAEKVIVIPLSAEIGRVDIEPARGRSAVVSEGGTFNPIPLAIAACDDHDTTRYPDCSAFLELTD